MHQFALWLLAQSWPNLGTQPAQQLAFASFAWSRCTHFWFATKWAIAYFAFAAAAPFSSLSITPPGSQGSPQVWGAESAHSHSSCMVCRNIGGYKSASSCSILCSIDKVWTSHLSACTQICDTLCEVLSLPSAFWFLNQVLQFLAVVEFHLSYHAHWSIWGALGAEYTCSMAYLYLCPGSTPFAIAAGHWLLFHYLFFDHIPSILQHLQHFSSSLTWLGCYSLSEVLQTCHLLYLWTPWILADQPSHPRLHHRLFLCHTASVALYQFLFMFCLFYSLES